MKRCKNITHQDVENFRGTSDSLRDKVYEFITEAMAAGEIRPGEFLDQTPICKKFNVSKAPLRDALLRLENEGFVTIMPRRGVYINPINLEFIKSAYQVIGALEADCLDEVFEKLTAEHVARFEESNAKQQACLDNQDFHAYYMENIAFHNIFLDLSENILIPGIVSPLRRRLYDFPRRRYAYEWEEFHLKHHERFIDSIKVGNKAAAISIFRKEHWSFSVHEPFLHMYYDLDSSTSKPLL